MNFAAAFDRLIGHEGALSLERSDRGNWTSGIVGVGELRGTKYGISAMSYPNEDIRNLTKARAAELYKRDFWDRINGDKLPGAVAFQVFDFAVNSGIGTAVRYLQRAIGVADDGHFGPVSQAAVAAMSTTDILMRFNGERLAFMTKLSTWPDYGRGWARRIAQNLMFAAEDS